MAISVNQKSARLSGKTFEGKSHSVSKRRKEITRFFVKPIKTGEVTFFTSQLSLMLEIGTPLKSSLKAIADQTENPAFKQVIQTMMRDIEEGRQLSDAMKRHPGVFNHVFISMIRAGETGGFLSEILNRIVQMQEKRQALIAQIKSALTYPMVLCIFGSLVVIFVLVGVLPKFTAFFAGKESILPFTTRFLMLMSASLRGYWWAYIVLGTGLFLGLKFFKDSEQGQALIDWSSVKIPILARLSTKINTCEMLRTLGHLMESQVPLLDALEVTRETIKNRYFKRFIDQIVDHVQQGGKFSQPFAAYPYVLNSVKQMVATGEEVGDLSTVMLRLAKFYDTEVDQELKALASMIEPLALIVMGGVVGLIVSSIILPLFKLSYALH